MYAVTKILVREVTAIRLWLPRSGEAYVPRTRVGDTFKICREANLAFCLGRS